MTSVNPADESGFEILSAEVIDGLSPIAILLSADTLEVAVQDSDACLRKYRLTESVPTVLPFDLEVRKRNEFALLKLEHAASQVMDLELTRTAWSDRSPLG